VQLGVSGREPLAQFGHLVLQPALGGHQFRAALADGVPPMRPETRWAFLMGYALAVRQCRAELMATQSWLQDEVAALRKELAAARAELHRLRAAQRDPDATLN